MDTEGQGQEVDQIDAVAGVEQEAPSAPPADEQPDPFESFARERGWSPKEEWRGKPEDWREPKDFISFGMERGRDANRELREMRSTVDRIGRVSETLMKRNIEDTRRELEAQFAGAVENKDHEGARAVREEISRLDQVASDPAPVQGLDEFKSRNAQWFGAHRAATALAQSITAEAAQRGIPPHEQLRMAEDAVKADFPHLFSKPADPKPAPAVSAPTTRAANPSPPKKTFASLPQEAQRAGQDFQKRGMVKSLEDYAKLYYEENA